MNLKEQLAALQKAMQAIVDRAKSEERDLTDEDISEVEAKAAEAEGLKEKIEKAQKTDELFRRVGELAPGHESAPGDGGDAEAKSLGDWFVKKAGDQLVKGQRFSASAPEFKADPTTIVTGGSDGDLGPLLTDVDRRIVTGLRRRLTIADLLGSETVSGSAITYFVEGALNGDFATVREGSKKAQIEYANPTPVTEALSKIAAFLKESDEYVEDLPFLASAINGRLLYNLGLLEEKQLLTGDGTSPNLKGILKRTGIGTEVATANVSGADNADAVFRAITKVTTASGLDADAIVINPSDYQAFRLSKDNNGQYFGGGFFSGEYGNGGVVSQPPLWGLRTVVTPAVAAKTVVVGSFAQAASVIRKGGVRVETANTNEDDFVNNRITIRAEERVGLAVRKPKGFVKVTLDYTAPAAG